MSLWLQNNILALFLWQALEKLNWDWDGRRSMSHVPSPGLWGSERENSQYQPFLLLLLLGSCFLSHLQQLLLSATARMRIMELLLLPQPSVQGLMAATLAAPAYGRANCSDNKTKSLAAKGLSSVCWGWRTGCEASPDSGSLGSLRAGPLPPWHLIPKAFFSPAGKAVTVSTRLILSTWRNESLQNWAAWPEPLLEENEIGLP